MKWIAFLLLIVSKPSFSLQPVVSPVQPTIGSPRIIAPVANQTSQLWMRHSGCFTNNYEVAPQTQVTYDGPQIHVVFRDGLGGTTVCVTPAPPRYEARTEIQGLAAGEYTLSIYLMPYEAPFPPTPEELSLYFSENIQFSVRGAPAAVDASSHLTLLLMTALMWLAVWQSRHRIGQNRR